MTNTDVFILGAGFSKAINSQMPTMNELTIEVLQRLVSPLPPPLQDPENRGRELDNNIELWMTYLSQSQPWLDRRFNMSNQALAIEVRRLIRDIITRSSLGSMTPPIAITTDLRSSEPIWLDRLIAQWNARRVSVITLNYDTLVERAAMAFSNPAINNGEGIPPSQVYPPYFSNIRSRRVSLVSSSPLETFTFYKLHGSVNWHYSGMEDFYGETIFYSDVSPWGSNPDPREIDSLSSAEDKETLIIPPVAEKTTYFNNETVRRLWQEASNKLYSAERVFVIGYSLPISDLGMQFFIKQSLPSNGTPWYIVNTDTDVTNRYSDLLEPQQTVVDEYVGEDDPVSRFVDAYLNNL